MLYVDIKYVNQLSTRLRNFKQKNQYLWNFSCPFCGDSSKNKLKARGYVYRQKSDLFFRCHNCGHGTNLGNLIKFVDEHTYKEYVLERYKEGATRYNAHKDIAAVIPEVKESPKLLTDSILDGLRDFNRLHKAKHPATNYVIQRRIPQEYWHLLYFAPAFKKFVNSVTPKFAEPIKDEHPRLIIPYFNAAGKCFAFQGRAFAGEEPKYYTIKVDENEEKIYGLDRVDYSKRIYIVEGPIDSLFLPNAIAVSGSSFDTPTVRALLTNATIVMDNEPRNKEIVSQLAKYIDLGYNVVMLPDTVQGKDINDMVKLGMTQSEIVELLNTNTYSGAAAKLKFATWRKC